MYSLEFVNFVFTYAQIGVGAPSVQFYLLRPFASAHPVPPDPVFDLIIIFCLPSYSS